MSYFDSASRPGGLLARNALKYLLSAALTVLFLYLAFRGTDFRRLWESMLNANYWWMIIGLGALMASHLLRAWRWRYLLHPLKADISIRNLFSGVMVGYMMNNVLPRAGELARPYTIGKLETISGGAAFGTIVFERIMDTVTFLLLVVAMPLVYHGPLRESFPWLTEAGVMIALVVFPLIVLLVTLMYRRDWTDTILRVAMRILPKKFSARMDRLVHNFLDGFLFLKHPSNFLIIIVLSILIWFLYAVQMYLALFAFGIQGVVGLGGAIVLLAISSIGVAMPTPGATGTYHAFTSQTLISLFGIDGAVSLSYATVTHAVNFIAVTVIGVYFFLKDNISISAAVARITEGRP